MADRILLLEQGRLTTGCWCTKRVRAPTASLELDRLEQDLLSRLGVDIAA